MLKHVFISLLFLVSVAFVSPVLAATLQLTSIGSVNTAGYTYSAWWYTSANPVLKGTAAPSAQVTITIDSSAQTITADTTGNWTYVPTTLTAGDHQIIIASSGEQYSFTLHIGSDVPTSTGSASVSTYSSVPNDLPVSGVAEVTIGLVAVAGALIFASTKLYRMAG